MRIGPQLDGRARAAIARDLGEDVPVIFHAIFHFSKVEPGHRPPHWQLAHIVGIVIQR
jgi:hypothetical protein